MSVRWRCAGAVSTVLLAALGPGAALASPGRATVSGHLYVVGGPAPGLKTLENGTVRISNVHGQQAHRALSNGRGYSFTLAAGRYRLSSPEGDITCVGQYFVLSPGEHLHRDLVCSIA